MIQSEDKKGSASKQGFRRCTHIFVIRFKRGLSVEFVFPILAAILSNLPHLEARRTESVHATDCKSEWFYSDSTSSTTLAVFCQIRCVICNKCYSLSVHSRTYTHARTHAHTHTHTHTHAHTQHTHCTAHMHCTALHCTALDLLTDCLTD